MVTLKRHHLPLVESTQDLVRQYGNATQPVLVSADQQAKGRGRHGRTWVSPLGNVYMSFNILDPGAPAIWGQWSLVLGVAVWDAIQDWWKQQALSGVSLTLKWPNDLLFQGMKVGGILIESSGTAEEKSWLIAGIGLNLTEAPNDLPYPATSLKQWIQNGGSILEVKPLIERIYQAYQDWAQIWRSQGIVSIREAWLARAHPIGTELEVRQGNRVIKGAFSGLDQTGGLLLMDDKGIRHTVSAAYTVSII